MPIPSAQPARQGQHAVAHVFGDEATGLGDDLGAAAVIGANDCSKVLGIELGRERGGADEVAEHHGQLAALGGSFC
jgi:hypothetical protein